MKRLIAKLQRVYRRIDLAYRRGFNRLLFSCRHMTHLASEAHERHLTLRERVTRRLHLWICRWCRRYDKQLRFLHRSYRNYAAKAPERDPEELSEEAKKRILEKLRSSSS